MKKIFSLLLLLSLVLPLAACGSALPEETGTAPAVTQTAAGETETVPAETAGPHDPTGFSVGFSRKVANPTMSVPLAGLGRTSMRMSKNKLDDITLTAVAVSDGENRALIITQDVIRCDDTLTETARKQIEKVTGVPYDNIFIAATHTHSSVDVSSSESSVPLWKTVYYKQLKAACQEALADLDHAEVEIGRIDTENLTYVRRYFLKDGRMMGNLITDVATADNPIVAPETDPDPELQIIRFKRSNQKDVVIANFQAHTTITSGYTEYNISADYVYSFRRAVERDAGVNCAYFLGASGNLNPSSKLEGDKNYYDYIQYGEKLAEYAMEVLNGEMEPVGTGTIFVTNREPVCRCDHSRDSEVGNAKLVNAAWTAGNDALAKELCAQYGFGSAYAAGSVISKASRGETETMLICALSFGDIAFVTAGYEMFSTTQQEIKAASPFRMTFVLSCSQEAHGYMPSYQSYLNGRYERDQCRYELGTAEQLRDEFIGMLNELNELKNAG